jgi:hypothetical protein
MSTLGVLVTSTLLAFAPTAFPRELQGMFA